jgi:hypothetical protein
VEYSPSTTTCSPSTLPQRRYDFTNVEQRYRLIVMVRNSTEEPGTRRIKPDRRLTKGVRRQ